MKEFVVEGMFWHAGDRMFIEVEDELARKVCNREVYDEVCLNDLMKSIKENSKVRIVIGFEE